MTVKKRVHMHVQPATVPMPLSGIVQSDLQVEERKPVHLTIVLQGHRQWAQEHSLSYSDALNAAAGRLLELIDFCSMKSIENLTMCLFKDDLHRMSAGSYSEFSTSFMRYITAGAQNLHRHHVRLQIVGELDGLDGIARGMLTHVARRTRLNKGMRLVISIAGSGDGGQSRSAIGGLHLGHDLQHVADPEQIVLDVVPDFVIRTGGPLPDHRSMLWDTRKTSLLFTDLPWPAFDAKSLQAALDWYGESHRTAGIESAPAFALEERSH